MEELLGLKNKMEDNIENKINIGTPLPQPKVDFYEEFCVKIPGKCIGYCIKYFIDKNCPKTCNYALEKEEERLEKIRE